MLGCIKRSGGTAELRLEKSDRMEKSDAKAKTDLCPTLEGERTILHPLRAEHADALFPILNDPELSRYTPQPRWSTLDELRDRYARLESRRGDDGLEHWLNWAIEEKTTGRIVGFVQATAQGDLSSASIAYVFGRAFWGRGLASDAVGTMLAHLKAIEIRTTLATVDLNNHRSVRLLERFRFRASDTSDPASARYVASTSETD